MDLIRSFLEDEKSRYIGGRVISSFKLTQDRWETMLKDDENRNYFGQFLKDPNNRRLFFSLNSKNLLTVSPTQFMKGKKALSMYKLHPVGPDDAKEFIRALAFVEIPKNPIGCIHKMLNNVYGPLSKSDHNVSRFSTPVANDILTTMSDITGELYLLLGKSQGMTMLAIPPTEILESEDTPQKIHSLESTIIQWIEQINRLVDTTFPENFNLTPLDEFKYWKKRRGNLEFLNKQLKIKEIKEVLKTVEYRSQPFIDQFKQVKKRVKEELKLAIETERSLQPLNEYIEQIDTVGSDMDGLIETFKPVFYLLYLIYSKTQFYHSPRNICNLLRRVTDFYTIQFASAIDGSSLINGDPSDSMEHLIHSQANLAKFNSAYFVFN